MFLEVSMDNNLKWLFHFIKLLKWRVFNISVCYLGEWKASESEMVKR
jgi:hypothetical protein